MSYGKFAPMTSALLARKGEAAPSIVAGHIGPAGIAPATVGFFDPPQRATAARPPAPLQEKLPQEKQPQVKQARKAAAAQGEKRRVVLTLTQEEFERLGIAAVKKNVTRHEFAREALFRYLRATARKYAACGCIAGKAACDCK